MKHSLWVVVVVVVGIVGFLLGYSYSSFTGVRETTAIDTGGGKEETAVAHPGAPGPAAGYGAQEPTAPQAASPGGQAGQAAETKPASPDQPSASPSAPPRRRPKPAAATAGY